MCSEANAVLSQASAQNSARALKRQLQRERRRMGRAEARMQQQADAAAAAINTAAGAQTSAVVAALTCNHEERTAHKAVGDSAVGRMKVVVKHTFIECTYDEFHEEETHRSSSRSPQSEDATLPAAEFETTPEFEEFRRAYRMFRLGFHRGAKGEVSSPKRLLDSIDLLQLHELLTANSPSSSSSNCSDRCSEADSDELKAGACTTATASTVADREDIGEEADGTEEEDQRGEVKLTARALKRQRQRERRRVCKADARAARACASAADETATEEQLACADLSASAASNMVAIMAAANPGCWMPAEAAAAPVADAMKGAWLPVWQCPAQAAHWGYW
eukprot:TRINITY_DN5934_c0_g1_i1.p1 TRINITY_DN5934_c0_g1~~TRINITY_DN5934_c0_g1_i1.p1  ORF type:complete len:335 (-),score=84.08 TRINITY_DN5934_c0_g1_i1:255-1259(-)